MPAPANRNKNSLQKGFCEKKSPIFFKAFSEGKPITQNPWTGTMFEESNTKMPQKNITNSRKFSTLFYIF